MTIALRAAGTATSATAAVSAVNPAVPSGSVVGDIAVLTVVAKPFNTTITTPSGWTKIAEATNGSTASGTDSGSTIVAVYVKEDAAVGSIGNLTQSNANTMGAVINVYSKTKSVWDFSSFTSGGDTTDGANYSATGAAGLTVATGDWVLASTAINGDVGTVTGFDIAGMSGATIGTDVERTNSAVTTGNDCRIEVGDTPITAGSSSAAPTFAYTNASSTSGTTLFLRLRESISSLVVRESFSSGADGDAMSAGNTGMTGVVVTGGSGEVDTAIAYSPTRAILTTGTVTSGGAYFHLSIDQVETLAQDVYLYVTTLPSAETNIIWWGNGATRNISIGLVNDGSIRIRDGGAAGGANAWTSSGVISTGQWYRISVFSLQHASAGTVRCAVFVANNTTPLYDSTLLTAKNTGASPTNSVRVGIKASTGTVTGVASFDDFAYDLGATDLIPAVPFVATATGIASAEALGSVTAALAATAEPTAIASAEAFGTAVFAPGGISALPSGIASAEAFGTAVFAPGGISALPTGIASAEALGAVTAALAVTAEPSGIASGEAFGTPEAVLGSIDFTPIPDGIASAEAFGTPAADLAVTGSPGGIASAEALGTPTAALAAAAVPDGIASGEAFGTPEFVPGPITAEPTGIPSGEAFGTPEASNLYIAFPTGIPSEEAFGSPAVSAHLTASPPGVVGAEQVGTPEAVLALEARPDPVSSEEGFGSPTAVLELVAEPSGIDSEEAFGTPSASGNPIPDGIASEEAFGAPVAVLALVASPVGIFSEEAFGLAVADLDQVLVLGKAYFSPSFEASLSGASAITFGHPTLTDWEAGE